MGKRFAIVIGVAAAGVMTLGAQTVFASFFFDLLGIARRKTA